MKKEDVIQKLDLYEVQLIKDELSERTINKYIGDIKQWLDLQEENINTTSMQEYKKVLMKKYAVSSVNSKLISINRYLKWIGHSELVLKTKRVQSNSGVENIINKQEYLSMLRFAEKTRRYKMYYIMRTIALTGVRVGELQYITVEALYNGSVEVFNKGKYRRIYIPQNLVLELLRYCNNNNIGSGIVFRGRKEENSISTVGVWKNMKYIASQVDVPLNKVYPHSFRHLFAKTYMEKVGDVTELSDLLGHSRLETTWIYTKTTSEEKRSRLEKLDL